MVDSISPSFVVSLHRMYAENILDSTYMQYVSYAVRSRSVGYSMVYQHHVSHIIGMFTRGEMYDRNEVLKHTRLLVDAVDGLLSEGDWRRKENKYQSEIVKEIESIFKEVKRLGDKQLEDRVKRMVKEVKK